MVFQASLFSYKTILKEQHQPWITMAAVSPPHIRYKTMLNDHAHTSLVITPNRRNMA